MPRRTKLDRTTEALAKWMHEVYREHGNGGAWERYSEAYHDDMRRVARALLERPPECLLAALAKGLPL